MSGKQYVFLSYGRKDVYPTGATNAVEQEQHFPLVEKVYHHLLGLHKLKQVAYEPWFDKKCLTHDRPFTDSIQQAIEQSDYLLLFIGAHSLNSEWCEREWKHALRHCVPVIPILLQGTWGDANIQATYPPRILSTDGIDPLKDGAVDETHLLTRIVAIVQQKPAPLTIPINGKTLPAHYIERPQYINDLKKRLGVNDRDYKAQSNIVGITSKQESAALQGVGGIGKTTLAAALCADCDVRRAFDHIFWLEAGPQTKAEDAPGLMRVIGAHFGDSPELYNDPQTARALVQKHLSNKRSLLVLDDVWHEGLKEQFSLAGLDLRLVVTTRQKRLVDHPATVDKLNPEEGLRLLATLFNPLNPDPAALTADHRAIVTELDGYTLAIEIAGRWLNKYGQKRTADYVKRLQEGEDTLFKHLELPQMSDKNTNLEKSLALSYNDLDADDQRRFRALGMFAAGSSFPLAALDALWGTDDGFMEAERLVDAGLLDMSDERYTQHSLLCAYARALLTRAGETDSLFPRFADHYIKVAEQFRLLPPEKWGVLNDDLPNIHLTGDGLVKQTDTGQTGDVERALAFAYKTVVYLRNRRQVRRIEWLEMGLNAARALQSTGVDKSIYRRRESHFLNDLGSAWSALGEKRRALEFFDCALSIDRELHDSVGVSITLSNLGTVCDDLGKRYEALGYYEQSLAISHEIGDLSGEATTLNNMGWLWSGLGDKRKALDYYEHALKLYAKVGELHGEATALNNIGLAWFDLRENFKALEFYEKALSIHSELGDQVGEATVLNNIGVVWSELGEKFKALEYFELALPIRHDVGDRTGEAVTCVNIATIYESLGDLENAIMYIRRSVELCEQIEHPDASIRRFYLEYLIHRRDNVAGDIDEEIAKVKAIVEQIYREQGEAGLRGALIGMRMSENMIEQVVAVVRGMEGEDAG